MLTFQPTIQVCQDSGFQDRSLARDLCNACFTGNIETISTILTQNANLINKSQPRIGIPPLCFASNSGILEVLELLLGLDAEVNIATKKATSEYPLHATPLWFAAQGDNQEMIWALLDKRAVAHPALDGQAKEKVEEVQKGILKETQQKVNVSCLIILGLSDGTSKLYGLPFDVIGVILKQFNELPRLSREPCIVK